MSLTFKYFLRVLTLITVLLCVSEFHTPWFDYMMRNKNHKEAFYSYTQTSNLAAFYLLFTALIIYAIVIYLTRDKKQIV